MMGKNVAERIIEKHLLSGSMLPGNEIGLRIDQTLTQDATGTMAYLEFEAMGVDRVRTERSELEAVLSRFDLASVFGGITKDEVLSLMLGEGEQHGPC